MSWAYVLGNVTDRGPEALLLRNGAVMGAVSLSCAGEIVRDLNDAQAPTANPAQVDRLHDVIVELYAMLHQAIGSRERDSFTGKESDDSKRARQLLERAGQIAQWVA